MHYNFITITTYLTEKKLKNRILRSDSGYPYNFCN